MTQASSNNNTARFFKAVDEGRLNVARDIAIEERDLYQVVVKKAGPGEED